MIVTVTPNPSVDRTLTVPTLQRGEVNRADAGQVDPGGKGVNVSRALAANGVPTRAVIPLAGPDGGLLGALLEEAGITFVAVPVAGPTRSNISVVEPDGTLTKINAAGHPLSAEEVDALLSAAAADLGSASWVVGCGSLPPDTRPDFFAALVERGHEEGVRVAIDSSGKPFEASLAARPDLVKPNHEELAELVGRPLDTIDDVVAAAPAVREDGPGTILVSLGKHGAVLVDGADAVLAVPPPIVPVSNVGAGDTLLAGLPGRRRPGPRGPALRRRLWQRGRIAAGHEHAPPPSTRPRRCPARAGHRFVVAQSTVQRLTRGANVSVSIDDLIEPDLVVLDLKAADSSVAIGALADRLENVGRLTDRDGFVNAVLVREKETGGTGMESGIAIPHGKHAGVARASRRLRPGARRRGLRGGRLAVRSGVPHRSPRRLGGPACHRAVPPGAQADLRGLQERAPQGPDAGGGGSRP